MTDYFLLLHQPRRPWLDDADLRERFFRLSAQMHPDHCHEAADAVRESAHHQFAELNAAHQCLRELKPRLRHLLELEMGQPPGNIQRIPPGTMDLFMEIGQTCREVDRFLAERAVVTSPLLRVRMFQPGMDWTDRLNGLQAKVNAKQHDLALELQAMNPAWETAPPPGAPERPRALPLDRLEQVYRALSYIARWTAQLQERLVLLAG